MSAEAENAERRGRDQGGGRFREPPIYVQEWGGQRVLVLVEYGPTYPETPGLVFEAVEREKRSKKGADVVRLAGDLLSPHAPHAVPSRFVSGHLSIKEVDTPDLTIRKAPSGTIEVVIRYD